MKTKKKGQKPESQSPNFKSCSQGIKRKSQLQTIFYFLQEHTATASMVEAETGIHHKNICRYKRDLEKAGRLWEVEKKLCKRTGFKAWYLTTNSELINDKQLKLF